MLHISMVSDIICPWCYVGKRRLEAAIHDLKIEDKVELDYWPYQLYPNTPNEGKSRSEFPRKQGTGEILRNAGKEVGIDFNFSKINKVPNTLPIHVALRNLKNPSIAWKIKEAFFDAYFCRGIDLTSISEVEQIASRFDITLNFKESSEDNMWSKAQDFEVNAVPAFILNNETAVVGAVDTQQWKRYFNRQFP